MENFQTLLTDEIPHLRRYSRFLVRNIDWADDLVQETLVRAIANAGQWEQGTNLRAWLFVILRNAFFNEMRKQKSRPTVPDSDAALALIGIPANQEPAYVLSEMADAFLTLPEDHREVLVVVVMEGLSYEAAAEILDVPIGTVRSRLSRARASLAKMLDGEEEISERRPSTNGDHTMENNAGLKSSQPPALRPQMRGPTDNGGR